MRQAVYSGNGVLSMSGQKLAITDCEHISYEPEQEVCAANGVKFIKYDIKDTDEAIRVLQEYPVLGNQYLKFTEQLFENLPNLKFLMGKAEYLEKFFPENSVERIYLNFSCPYPKETYKKHRLTHPVFLEIYKHILIPGGEIHQKTDNMKLFEFSIENLSQCGFKLKNISLDLHNSGFEGNIVTEYEKRFSEQGFPIYRLEAVNPTK